MPTFGAPQKRTFLFHLSLIEVAKLAGIGTFALAALFIGNVISPVVGLLTMIAILGCGLFLMFAQVRHLSGGQWLMVVIGKRIGGSRWSVQQLDHDVTPQQIVPDFSLLKIELRQRGDLAWVHHTDMTGDSVVWKISQMPFIAGLSYLPTEIQEAGAAIFGQFISTISRINDLQRFGFTSFDTPSSGRDLWLEVSQQESAPESYCNLVDEIIKKMRATTVWFFVLIRSGADFEPVVQQIESAFSRSTIEFERLGVSDLTWDLITQVSNPSDYLAGSYNNSLVVPRPELLKTELTHLVIDGRYHIFNMVNVWPRMERPYGWWQDAQLLTGMDDVSVLVTSWWEPVPASKALKTTEDAVQAAYNAQRDSAHRGKLVDTLSERRMHEAMVRSDELVSGASLHQIGGGFVVSARSLKMAQVASEKLTQQFRAQSADVSDCWGRQLESFRSLLPFGLGKVKVW